TATLRPLVKPKIIKRTKKFIWHQSDGINKIKCNWQKLRRVCRRFKDQVLTPSVSYRSNKETKPMLPRGFRKFLVTMSRSLKCCCCGTNLIVRLLTVSPPRTTEPSRREQPSWPAESPIPMPDCSTKKMNRQLMCMSHLH
ncbi:unnamed protein product, partial [Gulo gulo]